MGFLSIIEEKEIYSFMLDDEQWSRLKEKYKNLNMYMPYCDTKAIPKKINWVLSFLLTIHQVHVNLAQEKVVNINFANT